MCYTGAEGQVLKIRSGRVIGDQGIALTREMGPGTLFDRDGNRVGKGDEENEAFWDWNYFGGFLQNSRPRPQVEKWVHFCAQYSLRHFVAQP